MSGVSYTQFDLGYPPWALDFDPFNRGHLLVGGGGGEGQKEVPNKLTLLDVSNRSKIEKLGEVEVSDDSPASLGLLSAKDGLYVYAGINSGAVERGKGTNEHLRSFKVDFSSGSRNNKKKSKGGQGCNISPLGQASLFSPSYAKSRDAFQRLLRLSPAHVRPSGSKRIGAIANSFAEQSEIVVFDATNASPTVKGVIRRIQPPKNAEANDLDIFELAEGDFHLAYCTQSEIHTLRISYNFASHKENSPLAEPACVHSASFPSPSQKVGRAKYRCLRFIAPNQVLVLVNRGSQSELLVLRLYPKGQPGEVILRKNLPKRMGAAVSLDVCVLDEDSDTGERQVIVAVAAQANDITIFTLNFSKRGSLPAEFRTFKQLNGSHEAPMKKLALSPFHPPQSSGGKGSKERPAQQFVRLASISLSNMIVVDDLPLQRVETKSSKSRHVLSKSGLISNAINAGSSLFVIAFALVVTLVLIQSLLDAGAEGNSLSSVQLIPQPLRSFISRAREDDDPLKQVVQEAVDLHSTPRRRLRDLFHAHHAADVPMSKRKAILVRHSEDDDGGAAKLSTEVHSDPAQLHADDKVKKWDELSGKEQEWWKKRLTKAGDWAADEGETVLKSIFFSEIVGAVGRAAAEAIAG